MDEAVSAPLVEAAPPKKKRQFTTDQKLRAIIRSGEAGRWRDTKTKCLYLESHDGRSYHWTHNPRWKGKTTYGSYGGYPAVSVAEARERATQTRLDQRQGKDPAAAKKAAVAATARGAMTASKAYDLWREWMGGKWRDSTKAGCRNPFNKCPRVAQKAVNDLDRDDAYEVLARWALKKPTLNKERARLERFINHCVAQRWREPGKLNPFTWEGNLEVMFTQIEHVRQPSRPMGYEKLRHFVREHQDNTGIDALSLMMVAFSGSRGHTVREARWKEVDFDNLTWTRPSAHMKQKPPNLHEHTIHITPGMLRIFRFLYAIRTCGDDGLIFGSINGKVIDSTIWEKLLPENVDAHGLRTDFETWRQEQTSFSTDVGAVQLDHVIRDPQNDMIPANLVTRLYARSPLYNKRKEMMIEWDLFLTGGDYGGDLLEQWKVRLQNAARDLEAAKVRRREYMRAWWAEHGRDHLRKGEASISS